MSGIYPDVDADADVGASATDADAQVGIIQPALNVRKSIEKCAALLRRGAAAGAVGLEALEETNMRGREWPEVLLDGNLHTTFPYIPEHLEWVFFIFFSLLLSSP